MTKTLSVGLTSDSKINYVTFNFHNTHELEQFCDDLAGYILDKYNGYFLKLIIDKNYGYFDKTDKVQIYQAAKKDYSNMCSNKNNESKSFIRNKLYSYFKEENADSIVLEGFVLFRLGKYMQELEMLIDCAVDEYFIKAEYENFVMMLKEFVALQTPIIRLVHIFLKSDKRYCLCDENFEELTRSQILGIGFENESEIINEDDFLLSALISIAPKKIIIHQFQNIKNEQLLETLQKIFGNRLIMCEGCKICNSDRFE